MTQEPGNAVGAPPAGEPEEPEVEVDFEKMRPIAEAVLFASRDPLPAPKLAEILEIPGRSARALMKRIAADLDAGTRPYRLLEVAGGFQLRTREEFAPWVARLQAERDGNRFSSAMLETIAVIAYKQPVRRVDIEAIRGVASSQVLKKLMEFKLVKVVGRDDSLGKPLLYGTTRRFLEIFGLKNTKDLPKVDET